MDQHVKEEYKNRRLLDDRESDLSRTAKLPKGIGSVPSSHNKSKNSVWSLGIGALFCCMLWGSAPPFIKFGYASLQIEGTASILLFAGLRFFLSGILVLMAGFIMSKRFLKASRGNVRAIVTLACFQTFGQYLFYYLGLALTTSVMGSVLSGTSAFIALLLSAYVFHREKGTPRKLIGCLFGFCGILVMNLKGFSFHFGSGELMLLLSQLCSALSAVFLQIFSQKQDPVMLSGYQFTLGGAALIAVGLVMGGSIAWNLPGLGILIWLALVSAGAYTLWGILLKSWPVSSVSIYSCTVPIFGVLFSWLILQENQAFSWQTLLALVLIVLGVWMLNGLPKGFVNVPHKKDA